MGPSDMNCLKYMEMEVHNVRGMERHVYKRDRL